MANINGTNGNDTLLGTPADDTINGEAGDDFFNGGAGFDVLRGGAGNDTYHFDLGGGFDEIQDALVGEVNVLQFGSDIFLGDLTFVYEGTANLRIKVGIFGDMVQLNSFNQNNVYGSHPIETFQFADGTSLSYQNLIDSLGFTIMGYAGADHLVSLTAGADHMFGLAGNDWLEGAANDVLEGGTGDDLYFVSTGTTVVENANEGIDTVTSLVTWTLGANLEKLNLWGTSAINGTGNSLNNTFDGNSAANVLTGGAGDDTYGVSTGDIVVEQANEGVDTVLSDVTWSLGANIEKLTLTGTEAINGTGNSLNNTFNGNIAANVFAGGAGDDTYGVSTGDTVVEQANEGTDLVLSNRTWTLGANIENLTLTGGVAINGTGNELSNKLVGNSAANVFSGGAGGDFYSVSTGDTVVEAANEGTDVVLSDVSWTLGANLERLYLTGSAAIDGTGNELNNTLIGNSAVNVLTGLAGNDLFDGGLGADVLVGGTGDDVYYAGVGDTMVEAANEGVDRVLSNITWTLDANIEKLELFGTAAINGTGNSWNNIFTGNSAANVFAGGAGDDTYGVAVGDTVVEAANEGIDLVLSNVSFTLGANIEKLTLTGNAANGTGNALNNTLVGNSAANVLTGGAGDDTYGVSTGDIVVEQANEGVDTVLSDVTWSLGANIEKLTLTGTGAINGTGNSLNNTFNGNIAANVLTGGAGNDTLAGGLGNDTYRVNRGEGQDRISESDGTVGNSDRLLYGATINPLDLVLSRQVNDLRIAIHGSTDQVTVQNWYSAPTTAQVETIQAGNGQTLLSTQVDQLIQAMAGFTQQTGLTWDQAIDQQPQQVQTVLAASWQ